jgi:hypothetical protein
MVKEINHQLEIARETRENSASEEWLCKKLKLEPLTGCVQESTSVKKMQTPHFFHQQARRSIQKEKEFHC